MLKGEKGGYKKKEGSRGVANGSFCLNVIQVQTALS